MKDKLTLLNLLTKFQNKYLEDYLKFLESLEEGQVLVPFVLDSKNTLLQNFSMVLTNKLDFVVVEKILSSSHKSLFLGDVVEIGNEKIEINEIFINRMEYFSLSRLEEVSVKLIKKSELRKKFENFDFEVFYNHIESSFLKKLNQTVKEIEDKTNKKNKDLNERFIKEINEGFLVEKKKYPKDIRELIFCNNLMPRHFLETFEDFKEFKKINFETICSRIV